MFDDIIGFFEEVWDIFGVICPSVPVFYVLVT